MLKGKYLVIAFATLFVIAAIATTIARFRLDDQVGLNQAGIGLAKVQKAAAVWAQERGGEYPEHIALLQANNYFRAKLLRDPRLPAGTVFDVGGFDARPYLEEVIVRHGDPRLDREPLLEAVAADPAGDRPWYRFGDYYFVRLDRYRESARLIFGWTLADEEGRRFIVFDGGQPQRVDAEAWASAWQRDAEERAELGLPPLETPAFEMMTYAAE